MSLGMTPYDFVQQVYYAQEKVVLDFHRTDDKYKEVLFEANLVIQELQKEEDWSWLRQRIVLGPTDPHFVGDIPEFELPDWVYHPAMMFDDCVKLCRTHHGRPIDDRCIKIPWSSAGALHHSYQHDPNYFVNPFERDPLCAVWFGNTITFNHRSSKFNNRVAVTDVIRRMPLLHICDDNCPLDDDGNCKLVEDKIFTEIPDPNYMVIKTAAYHAAGSPVASPRAMDLNDQAQKILSSMRSNDAAHTVPDTITHYMPSVIDVI